MKKLNLLLLSVILFALALNATAQTEVFYKETNWAPLEIDCNGDGVIDDVLSGTQWCQLIHHYNPITEVFEWYINRWKAELTSASGEVFSVNYYIRGITDGDFNNGDLNWGGDTHITIRYNARGSAGSHYLVTSIWFFDFATGTMDLIKNTVKCL